jgi:pimeloyl-ACP methyl ester carboxylesterase
VEIAERQAEVAGMDARWLEVGTAPILYVHGVPTASFDWLPLLELTGGVAPDLPGFGHSAKPAEFDYSIRGYDRWLEAFVAQAALERFSLVVHDWGVVGLAFAQRFPQRIEKLLMFSSLPFLSGYRWHRLARAWRTPLAGELVMGFTSRRAFRRALPSVIADSAYDCFDHGTQRAILKLSRASPPEALARAGERLGAVRCPALLLWPTRDPYIPEQFGARYADALGGAAELELVETGHWSWHEQPALVERAAGFLR